MRDAKADILGNRQPRQQPRLLEDDADLLMRLRDDLIVEMHERLCRPVEPGDRAQQGGLAATGAADNGDDLARRDIERELLERADIVRIGLGDAGERQHDQASCRA